MIKLVCLINRPDGVDRQAFSDWWLGHHAELVAALPGLRRYTISVALPDGARDAAFDGVAELWFDSPEAMDESFASPTGQQVSREDRECIGQRVAFITEEHVIR